MPYDNVYSPEFYALRRDIRHKICGLKAGITILKKHDIDTYALRVGKHQLEWVLERLEQMGESWK